MQFALFASCPSFRGKCKYCLTNTYKLLRSTFNSSEEAERICKIPKRLYITLIIHEGQDKYSDQTKKSVAVKERL